MVAETVLLRIGVVGVAWAEGLGDVAVVLAALILVTDQSPIGVPVVLPSKTPEGFDGIRLARCVTWREVPSFATIEAQAWMFGLC